MDENRKSLFETKILPLLEYIGLAGAILASIAYIIVVVVLIKGFEVHKVLETTVFAVVNAIVGLIIMNFLKLQGVSFAKNIPENKEILNLYYQSKTKERKYHSIRRFWITSTIKDVLTKGLSLAITTIGVIYLVIEGSNDYRMLALAAVNLIMFICFGLLSLNSAYEYYNNEHIPYIKDKLNLVSEVKECTEQK